MDFSNSSIVKVIMLLFKRVKSTPIKNLRNDLNCEINQLTFWPSGEMAYTAIKQVNYLRVQDKFKEADSILSEWNF